MAAPETEGAELVQEVKPNHSVKLDSEELLSAKFQQIGDNEFVIYKPRWGAFYGTQLEDFFERTW